MKKNKRFKRLMCVISVALCAILCVCNYSPQVRTLYNMPETVYLSTENGQEELEKLLSGIQRPFALSGGDDIAVLSATDEQLSEPVRSTLHISLFGVLPIKTVDIVLSESKLYVPSGQCVGIGLHTRGVLVVGTGEVLTGGNSYKSPCKMAGIKAGDVITKLNGETIRNTDHLAELCKSSGSEIKLEFNRSGKTKAVTLQGVFDPASGAYKLGAWVRDSTAGIGTLSFYNPQTLEYAGLGHAVADIDTGVIFEVANGRISDCDIIEVVKGKNGSPGELVGAFSESSGGIGTINSNTPYGIYGALSEIPRSTEPAMEIAYADEVKKGEAYILSSVIGGVPQRYSCKIVKVYKQDSREVKGLVVEITDSRLLSYTGGIVQGMSGSPIIQNNKIAAVLTHVMINDSARGYCIYAQWMAQTSEQAA